MSEYKSRDFNECHIKRSYANVNVDGVYWIDDVNSKGQTIRMRRVLRSSLPSEIADECDALRGQAFNGVEL